MLHAIDLPQDLPGYEMFLSCWIVEDKGFRMLIDPGPSSSVEHLHQELTQRGVERIDLILLTHIHLDHAGATGEILELFPGARCFVHPAGRPHLEDPEALWQGSLQTIGAVATHYGRPRPVPPDRFVNQADLSALGIQVLDTPGHAAHHSSFLWGATLFAGEAICTRIPLGPDLDHLRPATPPRFFPEVFLSSLERLAALEPEPQTLAFAHWGNTTGVRSWCQRARAQLQLWIEICAEEHSRDAQALDPVRIRSILEQIEATDPDFRLAELDPAVRERERFYAANNLRGIWGSLKTS